MKPVEAGLWRYSPPDVEAALREAEVDAAWPPFPPANDRAAWEAAARALGYEGAAALVHQADLAARELVPPLPATLWLALQRTGQREGYERPQRQRRSMLASLALAECIEARGRFLDPLLDVVWAICEESSWCMPAHQSELADLAQPVLDLNVALTALQLAELDALLGAQLPSAVGARIRFEVNRRCLTPYLQRHNSRWMFSTRARTVNNWTAVCTGGIVGAALYLEPQLDRLAAMVAKAARSLEDYLATFDGDGGTTEGPGYWSYGFGYCTVLAQLVEARTGGRVSFLEGELISNVAQFPLRTLLSPGRFVNFSDCDARVSFMGAHLAYLARRLGLPALMVLARQQPLAVSETLLTWGLRRLFWRPEPPQDVAAARGPVPNRHDFFRGMHWMIGRARPEDPGALVLAAKGGHNGEMHNQNDVGNIIVHVGGESIIADIGRGRYTRDYFGPHRYEHLANSSLGHSVPVPNGQAQLSGQEHGAQVLAHRGPAEESRLSAQAAGSDSTAAVSVQHPTRSTESFSTEQDVLALELRDAYPAEADLMSLRRRVVLHRDAAVPWVELEDRVQFAMHPGTLESVLTTFGAADVQPGAVRLRGEGAALEVAYDPVAVVVRIDVVPGVDLAEGPRTVTRVLFALQQPVRDGTIRLEIRPATDGLSLGVGASG